MKKEFFIILVSLLFAVSAVAQDKQYEAKVDGLSCPICSYGLEKKLKSIDGIYNIKIELTTGLVTFAVKEGKTVTEELLKKKVKEAGYTLKEMKLVIPAKKS